MLVLDLAPCDHRSVYVFNLVQSTIPVRIEVPKKLEFMFLPSEPSKSWFPRIFVSIEV